MSAANPAYLEVIDFIANGTTSEALIAFRPSPEMQRRVQDLVERDKQGTLALEEKQELADTLQLEHILIMAKAQAKRKLLGVLSH